MIDAKRHEKRQDGRSRSGRKTKLDKNKIDAILLSVSKRVPYEIAAYACGVTYQTLYNWINTGKEHLQKGLDTDHARFVQALYQVEQEKIIYHSDKIADNIERWQSDAWMLERRWAKHYGPNAQVNELNEKLSLLLDEKKSKEMDDIDIDKDDHEC